MRRTTAGFILGAAASLLLLVRPKTKAPPSSRANAASAAVNETFHEAYDAARSSAGFEAPLFIVLADVLVLCRGDRADEFPLSPPDFDFIKSAAHAPVALYAILSDAAAERALRGDERRVLSRLRESVRAALRTLGLRTDAVATAIRDVLQRSLWFAESVLGEGRLDRATLDGFARECRSALERLTEQGTRAQLAALDRAVEEALSRLKAGEQNTLQVVVAGEHQARTRSLGMQYFKKRFGEAPGVENRVTYGERVTSVEEGRALVGTIRLDRALAAAFFGDEKRLQRDVLGDAAAAILAERDFERIA